VSNDVGAGTGVLGIGTYKAVFVRALAPETWTT